MAACDKHRADPVKGYHHCAGCEIESLQADLKLAQAQRDAGNREIERLRAIVDSVSAVNLMRLQAEIERLRTELAASQAREKVLREMFLLAVEFGAIPAFSLEELRKQFLALPADDTALREMLARAQEEMRERCAHAAHEAWIREPDESPMVALRALEVKS